MFRSALRSDGFARRAALLAMAGLAPAGLAQNNDWMGGDGQWFDGFNWHLGAVPASDEVARLGNRAAASDADVLMGDLLTTAFDRFEISSGVKLDTNGTRLRTHDIDQASTIAGSGSALLIRPSRSAASDDFRSAVSIGSGTRVELFDGALAHIQGERP